MVKNWFAEKPFGRDGKSCATCSIQWAFVHEKIWQNGSIPKVSQPRWGAHFSGRVQERILNMASVRDARAVAFESVCVQIAVHACQQVVRLQDSPHHGARRSEPETQESRPSTVTPWESLDHISVNDVFSRRFEVLQSCPAHLRGRWRQSVRVALEARHRGISNEDGTRDLQGWKLFCLLPFWLLRRPRSKGHVGKAELTKRFGLFGEGRWTELHRGKAGRFHPTSTARSHVRRAEGQSC